MSKTFKKASFLFLVFTYSIVSISFTHAKDAIDNPIPDKIPAHSSNLALVKVAEGFTGPLDGEIAPIEGVEGFNSIMFIADQVGIIWRVNLITGAKSKFIDLRSRIVRLGAFSPGGYDERGLLGIAFHPSYQENGLLYVFTSEPVSGDADFSTLTSSDKANHQSLILELAIENPTKPVDKAVIKSTRELLRIDQPQYNHNGGSLAFDSNGLLYIGIGDGGKSDDQGPGHGEKGNSGDLSNPLGAILRIDPLGRDSTNKQYGIPANNPFVGSKDALSEIYAYGLRNPWKISFDNNGNLYAADVGQNHVEEINIINKGGHYGWPIREGRFWFDNNGSGRGFVSTKAPDSAKGGYIDPVLQYDHDEGVSITGGYVYHGNEIKSLKGRYVFADFRGRIFIGDIDKQHISVSNISPEVLPFSFALDHHGEIYLMGNADANTRGQSGELYKIVEAQGND